MIQPITLTNTNYRKLRNVNFKNTPAVVEQAAVKPSEQAAEQSDLLKFMQDKEQREKKLQRNGYIFAGIITAASIGAMFYLPKAMKSTAKTKRQVFESFKDDKDIPTLDTCKSINSKLKNFLENQVLYSKATKEDLVKTGMPESANRLIMYGPPGSGKSFFSKIFAKTIGAEYLEVNYSEISRRFIGEQQENFKSIMKDIMSKAKESPEKKFVVNFNEIESIMMPLNHVHDSGGGHIASKKEERSIFLTTIEEMNKLTPNVIFIGSTNASAKGELDGAALSRFKNIIKVEYPNKTSLLEALKANIELMPEGKVFVENNKNKLEEIAENMYNRQASFRDLNNIVNESKNIYLRKTLKDKTSTYKIDYIEDAVNSLELTDGEMSNIKKQSGK